MSKIELRADPRGGPEDDVKRVAGDSPKARRRPIVAGLVVVGALAGFAVAVGYAYQKGREAGTSDTVPIVTAQPGPFKVKPDNPGGMVVPNRDMEIYERFGGNQQPAAPRRESLLPGPEKPVSPPRPTPTENDAASPPVDVATPGVVPPPPPPSVAGPAKSIAEATATPKPSSRNAVPPSAETNAKSATNETARKVAKTTPAAGGSYRVQLGALRSDIEARGAWSRLQKRHSDLLGSLALNIDRKDMGGDKGIYFRMQAGPLASESDARGLCSRLKQRQVDCLVVHL